MQVRRHVLAGTAPAVKGSSDFDVSRLRGGCDMRGIGWSLALLVATGCSTGGDYSFEHQSTLETRARGFGIHDDGTSAQVGMGGNTCEVETASAMIGNDYDVAVSEDD